MLKNILIVCLLFFKCFAYKALIVVPVADLLGQSAKSIKNINSQSYYSNLLPSTEFETCYRINQSLFNDVVNVLQESDEEVQIEVSTEFFSTNESKYNNKFWTQKKNILPVSKINKDELFKIPRVNSFKKEEKTRLNYVTLIKPFKKFSAGTNFVVKEKLETGYIVYIFDTNNLENDNLARSRMDSILRPCSGQAAYNLLLKDDPAELDKASPRALVPSSSRDTSKSRQNIFNEVFIPNHFLINRTQNKINDFLTVLKSWAHQSGVIPYIWGGTSFCKTYTKDCSAKEFHERLSKIKTTKCGLDCAGLIYRAAKIANLPYYFKNTTTLSQNLKPLEKGERIENGDLIFFKGHVIVISNITSDLCIEARGYSHGYGIVQEIKLNKLFKDVNTFTELKQKYFNNEKLERLNSESKVIQIIPSFKILKLKSCFNWKYS